MEVNIYQAKNSFLELVKRAEKGEEVILSRRGHPVAKLVKISPKTRRLGLFHGQIKELDAEWSKPTTAEDVQAFYRGDD